MIKKVLFFGILLITTSSWAKSSKILEETETLYKNAKSIKMQVDKVIKMKILERETQSQGVIYINRGGKLRWDTEKPEKSMILSDGKVLWLVEYPTNEEEKTIVLKAINPSKSQPHAVIAFLMGKGKLSDGFAVLSEKNEGNLIKLDMKPREEMDQMQWLTININKKSKNIEKISFEDNIGSVTELSFSKIDFNAQIPGRNFKFKPPKNSAVTIID